MISLKPIITKAGKLLSAIKLFFPLSAQGLKARGNVEEWLGKVEESMVATLRKLTKYAIGDYEEKTREEWVTCHASQVRKL